jgi:Lon protease-like protein
MKLPRELPVMTLPNATLFPQALLPLFIFEPRYRQMLADALHADRMFAVAMQRPGSSYEIPAPEAGVGLIRASVRHNDGTSYLILQGLARVELEETVRYKPYRVHRIRPLATPPRDTVAADMLLAKVYGLLRERVELGRMSPFPFTTQSQSASASAKLLAPFSTEEVLGLLDFIPNPELATDLVSRAVLFAASEQQAILETVEVEARLRQLVKFLLPEISNHRKGRHE